MQDVLEALLARHEGKEVPRELGLRLIAVVEHGGVLLGKSSWVMARGYQKHCCKKLHSSYQTMVEVQYHTSPVFVELQAHLFPLDHI
jgi:hypothetical protein